MRDKVKYWYAWKRENDFVIVRDTDGEILQYASTLKDVVYYLKSKQEKVKRCAITEKMCYIFI